MAQSLVLPPELLGLVFSHCNHQDIARWVTVSGYFFSVTTPFIWNHVVCTHVAFLSLIKGTTVQKPRTSGGRGAVGLPDKITRQSVSRLKNYGQFIENLELRICSPATHCVLDSAHLIAYTKQQTLLPKIHTLHIKTDSSTHNKIDWVVALFSSSLRQIRVIPATDSISPLALDTAFYWLTSIASRCPSIQILELHPYCEWLEWDERVPKEIVHADARARDRFWEPLAELKQLRHLCTNGHLTQRESMISLSSLPALGHLDLSGGYHPDTFISTPDMTHGSFPMLSHLALRNLRHINLMKIWENDEFLQKLKSLNLVIGPNPKDIDEGYFGDGILVSWLPGYDNVAKKFRNLSRLAIEFEVVCVGCIKLTEDDLRQLSLLKLEYLRIGGTDINIRDQELGTWCEFLVSLWPEIEELHWPDQTAYIEDLVHFANLPKLRHLTLDLRVMPAPDTIPTSAQKSDVLDILECSRPPSFIPIEENCKQVARFLYNIWPNISLTWPRQDIRLPLVMRLIYEYIEEEQKIASRDVLATQSTTF